MQRKTFIPQRQRILTPTEQQIIDTPPRLAAVERQNYFHASPALAELLATLRTPTNQVGFLVQLGCFRAIYRFFIPPYPLPDVAFVVGQLDVPTDLVEGPSYDEATTRRHRRLILDHVGFRPFDETAKQRVTTHLRPLIRSQIRPKILFGETITFLHDQKIELPSSATLTQLILDIVRQHKHELVKQVRTNLPSDSQQALDALFEKAPAATEDLQVQRTRLTLLKRFSHSTKPSKIKENLADLLTIRALYQPLQTDGADPRPHRNSPLPIGCEPRQLRQTLAPDLVAQWTG